VHAHGAFPDVAGFVVAVGFFVAVGFLVAVGGFAVLVAVLGGAEVTVLVGFTVVLAVGALVEVKWGVQVAGGKVVAVDISVADATIGDGSIKPGVSFCFCVPVGVIEVSEEQARMPKKSIDAKSKTVFFIPASPCPLYRQVFHL
jgi:hypothetical protein